jgi:predicted RNA-binding Zn-ribbon protein involved in translation (DUF1610 family)
MTGKRPWRCHICGWRGWFEESELRYPSSAAKQLPPEIAGSDVPIPDLQLEGVPGQAGIPTTKKEMNDEEALIEGNLMDANGRPDSKKRRERRFSNREGEKNPFAVFGIEISEPIPDSRNDEQLPAAARYFSDEGVSESNSQGGSAEEGGTLGRGTFLETGRPAAELMTGPPPEFSEQSGRPVSSKVGTAFHHESRNKSWTCPKCSEFALYRSRARTIGEIFRKQLSRKRPYRCHRCGWRGWLTK